jgi:hypothetical protein
MREGRLRVYGVQVGDKLPTLPIPLIGAETCALDLDQVYQTTFISGRWGRRPYMDYSIQPPRIHTYTPRDQTHIAQRMAAILGASVAGLDLETWDGTSPR